MTDAENFAILSLRILNEWPKNFEGLSVEIIFNSHLKHDIEYKPHIQDAQNFILKNNLADLGNDNRLKINEAGKKYLVDVTTDEYLVNTCFQELKKKNSPTYIDQILTHLHIKIPDAKRVYIESIVCESGLANCDKKGYYPIVELNHKGIISLTDFKDYSDYKNHLLQQKKDKESIFSQTINVGRDMVGNLVSQESDFREARPALYPNQNISKDEPKTNQTPGLLMKFWKLISDNKLISTILAGLILAAIYYFLFGAKPGGK